MSLLADGSDQAWAWWAVFRDATWLTEERARGYGRIAATGGVLLIAGLAALYLAAALVDPRGQAYSCDFNAFWSAAHLAAGGHPALAYDPDAMKAAEALNAQPAPDGGYLPFLYPPPFLLLCLPLGVLPYGASLAVFLISTTVTFWACIRSCLPASWPFSSVVAFPGVLVNAISTQNGCLSASLFCGGMKVLGKRPVLAGMLLGLFAFKPQLAICIPLALCFAGRWRAFVACAGVASLVAVLSWLVFGTEVWLAFLRSLPTTRVIMYQANIWGTGNSVYAATRILQGGDMLGLAAQAVCAFAAIACVAMVAACRREAGGEIAASIAAAFLCTPYVMDYDLVCLGVPMAWVAAQAVRGGWRPWEKILLAVMYLYPLGARSLALHHLPFAPLLTAALLVLVVRRVMFAPARGLG